MRLTLRTLLAYIDHVLDPNDARELAVKIRESKLAQHTMERIDVGLANRNLGTPAATSTDSVQDPNLLAEYLDNTMPAEDVPQFERHCFENDAQLIEAASVHRILAVVLSKPVEVSGQLAARLKGLINQPNTSTTAHGSVVTTEPPVASVPIGLDHASSESEIQHLRMDPGPANPSPTEQAVAPRIASTTVSTHGLDLSAHRTNSVPEYLRDRSEGVYFQLAMAAVLLIALWIVAWRIIGPWDQVQVLLNNPNVVVDAKPETADPAPAEQTVAPKVVKQESPEPRLDDAETLDAVAVTDAAPPTPAASTIEQGTDIIASDTAAPPPVPAQETTAAMEQSSVTIQQSPTVPPSPAGEIVADSVAPLPPTPEPGAIVADSSSPLPTPPSDSATQATNEIALSSITWQPENKDSAAAVVMAYSVTAPVEPVLRMVNIAESLPATTRLVVPDAYRTELRVAPGLKWTVASATDLQSEQTVEPKHAYVRLRIGRAIVSASADCSTLVLFVGKDQYKIEMDSPAAIASVELRYFPNAGASIAAFAERSGEDQPRSTSELMLPVLTIGSVSGSLNVSKRQGLSWSLADALPAGSVVAFVDGLRKAPHVLTDVPWWYRTSIERPIDAGAANDLALELQVPATADYTAAIVPSEDDAGDQVDLFIALAEATKVRRAETAALAARTLAILGRYEAIFGKDSILNLSNSRPHRSLILESVLQSLGIDAANADALVATLSAYDPPRGTRLLNMLSLPDAKMLATPEVPQMFIDGLSSSFLDERVVAIHQLTKITGKEYTYQPDRVTSEALSQWRKVMGAGKIEWNAASIKPLDWESQ